jgi:hypothetical protein
MARVWTTPIDVDLLIDECGRTMDAISALSYDGLHLPWIDNDPETSKFIAYWFAPEQARDLRRLAWYFKEHPGRVPDVLRLALSKIIVTKDRGASLARDVSHSRPHRVSDCNGYDVFVGFRKATKRILTALSKTPPLRTGRIVLQDGRSLHSVRTKSVDCVLTSPPYLNAIDYIRGHRLALVWMGYRVADLRAIRGESVGAERKSDYGVESALWSRGRDRLPWITELSPRFQEIFRRYLNDLHRLAIQVKRVLRSDGLAVLVVGNSTLKGVFVKNSDAVELAFENVGLRKASEVRREIPQNRRYLPPPNPAESSSLGQRMRTEVVLTYRSG